MGRPTYKWKIIIKIIHRLAKWILPDSPSKSEEQFIAELHSGLAKNQFFLAYQPIFANHSQQLLYFEALIRWQHPRRGLLNAVEFIPLAEKTGLILNLGEWVLKTVCEQLVNWQNMQIPLVPIAINISGLQFKQQGLSKLIKKYLQHYALNPHYLELEFTESVLIEDTEKTKQDMAELKNLNIKLTIDDFGTYYSNLAYLKYFAVDKIKIDKTFIRDLASSEEDRSLIRAIIAFAHSLKLKVVVEGIENAEQFAYLREQPVDELQGFYLGKPISNEECLTYLRNLDVGLRKKRSTQPTL